MDAFSWSIPFVCEKVSDILLHIAKDSTMVPIPVPDDENLSVIQLDSI